MTLLDDNTVGGAVILRSIKFLFAIVWISVGLLCIYIFIWPYVYPIPTCTGPSGT